MVRYADNHKKDVIEKARKAREEWLANKGTGKGQSLGKGKDKDRDKETGRKGKICPYFNDKGCNYGSARKMLH